jgi:glycosyltransferase involved in cell wall biosynthesis
MGPKSAVPVLVGPFSGPVHGVSIINNQLREVMRERGAVFRTIDLSPGRWLWSPFYHLTRAARAVRGVLRILAAPLAAQRRRYIMSVDGGLGLAYNIALALAARLTGQAILLYHHSSRYVQDDSTLMRILLIAAGNVPHVFCSPRMASLFFDRYRVNGAAILINNAAWVASFPKAGERPEGRIRLGFLSALTVEKGVGRAIETLRMIRNQGVAAELVLAGEVTSAEVCDLIGEASREFGPLLVCPGVLQGRGKADFFAGLDYFLFPSLYGHETQSLVVPEALSAGVPVIAFDHRFVGEVLGDGGLLVSPSEPFADKAAQWIVAGKETGDQRRRAACHQFTKEHTEAAGQVDRLVAWSLGDEAGGSAQH